MPKKRGKLLSFLRSFVKARPKEPKQREMELEKEKEGVFGCDLGEHLLHSGRDGKKQPVPESFLCWAFKDEGRSPLARGRLIAVEKGEVGVDG